MNVVPFQVVSLGLYTVIPVITPMFEAFHEVPRFKLGKKNCNFA
jgi:hypothetical protein